MASDIDAVIGVPAISSDAAPPTMSPPDAAKPDAGVLPIAPIDAAPSRKPPVLDARPARDPSVRLTTVDASKPAVAALQRVQFGAKPWAYVTIDDNGTVYETPATVELTVGSHNVVFTNPALGAKKALTINVVAAGDNRFVVDLLAP